MVSDSWPFADPKNVAVFTTTQVFRDGRPILYVSHDLKDGAWQFHTGDETDSASDAMVVALCEMIEIDPSLIALHDLPIGWSASRDSLYDEWQREPVINEDQFAQLIYKLRRIQEILCENKMDELSDLLDDRSQSSEVLRVLNEYPAIFSYPPEDFHKELRIIHHTKSSPHSPKVHIDMPMWSSEEGRSDLEVQLWALHQDHTWQVFINDIRVP